MPLSHVFVVDPLDTPADALVLMCRQPVPHRKRQSPAGESNSGFVNGSRTECETDATYNLVSRTHNSGFCHHHTTLRRLGCASSMDLDDALRLLAALQADSLNFRTIGDGKSVFTTAGLQKMEAVYSWMEDTLASQLDELSPDHPKQKDYDSRVEWRRALQQQFPSECRLVCLDQIPLVRKLNCTDDAVVLCAAI